MRTKNSPKVANIGHSNSTPTDAAERDYGKCHCRIKGGTDESRLKLINAPTLARADEFPMNSCRTSENSVNAKVPGALKVCSGPVRWGQMLRKRKRAPNRRWTRPVLSGGAEEASGGGFQYGCSMVLVYLSTCVVLWIGGNSLGGQVAGVADPQ